MFFKHSWQQSLFHGTLIISPDTRYHLEMSLMNDGVVVRKGSKLAFGTRVWGSNLGSALYCNMIITKTINTPHVSEILSAKLESKDLPYCIL